MTQSNGPTTLADIFATSAFEVPSFQRAYAWTVKPHLQDFLDDLRNHPRDGNTRYFYGTILLTTRKPDVAHLLKNYAVVDGQQRLTTACIFVAAALEILSGQIETGINDDYYDRFIKKRNGVRKLRTIIDDEGMFGQIMLQSGLVRPQHFGTPSQRRLFDAKEYFVTKLKSIPSNDLLGLLNTLANSQILVYAVESNLEATQIFELQNDRGKRLTDLEGLKSFLMHSLYLHAGENSESDLEDVQFSFSEIYRASERIEAKYDAPDDDQLLGYHCVAFEAWKTLEEGEEGWAKPKQLVRRLLDDLVGQAKADFVRDFSRRLAETFNYALHILEARDNCEPLGDLTVLGRTAIFWPLLLKCWKFDVQPDRCSFTNVVHHMERFAFRAAIAGKRSDAAASKLRGLARDFTSNFDELAVTLEVMTSRLLKKYPVSL
jgi:hypothetical protein